MDSSSGNAEAFSACSFAFRIWSTAVFRDPSRPRALSSSGKLAIDPFAPPDLASLS